MKKKAIGILGGMGPQASVYLYKIMIELAIKEFQAKNNDDFPEIIIHSIPVPDFISNEKQKQQALKMLQERVIALNNLNLSYLSIACNTAHLLLPDLQKISKISFISMIEEVCSKVKNDNLKKVGILGTPATLNSELYQKELGEHGIKSILPLQKDFILLEIVIRNVINGSASKQDEKLLARIANYLYENGAEGIILGCTELPLVFPKYFRIPIYNSVEVLARALLRKYYKSNTIRV